MNIFRLGGDKCWIWIGGHTSKGYGVIGLPNRRTGLAHRVAYELYVGPIPEGLVLDHLCGERCCVNPAHLEPVTTAENNARSQSPSAINARKTHCSKGHPLAGDNVYVWPRTGARRCRICHNENLDRYATLKVAA